jgi:hypothetical protein
MVQFGFGSRVAALVAASMMAGMSVSAVAKAPDPKGDTAAAASDKPAASEHKAQPTKYCIVMPKATGSIVSGKVCKTRDQWLEDGIDPTAQQQ